MALPLPNLDDRRWADLVEEGRALIPLHAPDWTDHNVHDPGMTLIDLLAWVTEAVLYGINRIRDSHLRKFLALVGIRPAGPAAAHAIASLHCLAVAGEPDAAPIRLPASTELEAATGIAGRSETASVGGVVSAAGKETIRFRTVRPLDVQPARLVALQVRDGSGFLDITLRWVHGEEVQLFGPAPCPGTELYLGFEAPLKTESELALYLRLARDEDGRVRSGEDERRRLLDEAAKAALRCPSRPTCDDEPEEDEGPVEDGPELAHRDALTHHSARLVWEYLGPTGSWRPVEGVIDETRAFTLDGHIAFRIPAGSGMARGRVGEADMELYYARCRLDCGFFDAPPKGVLVANAVRAVQAIPAASTWELGEDIAPPALEAGVEVPLDLTFDPNPAGLRHGVQARLTGLSVSVSPGAEQPSLRVLRWTPPNGGVQGFLDIEAEWLGRATGTPNQRFELHRPTVLPDTLRLFTMDGGEWHEWRRQLDPFASRRGDRHYLLDPTGEFVVFGDGQRGRVAPPRADVLAVYETTLCEDGNLAPQAIDTLSRSLHNAALIPELDTVRLALEVSSPLESREGTTAESLESALGRAFLIREERTRAVTLEDCEAMALETPGTRIARAAAWPDVHPDYPCFTAPGLVTVVVVPYLPASRPRPSAGLLRQVQAYLDLRSMIGTRIVVTGPTYRCLSIQAIVRALPDADSTAIPRRASAALDAFFHPLRGGPNGDGWPLGRDVFRSEVMQILEETLGVDNVVSLELVPDHGEPSCGNLCLRPTELIATASHRIEVVA